VSLHNVVYMYIYNMRFILQHMCFMLRYVQESAPLMQIGKPRTAVDMDKKLPKKLS
jgi:hypothetical protein